MKVILFGAYGWLGSFFSNILNDFDIDFIKTNIRADNYNDVELLINQVKPTHLISFIGRTHGQNINSIDYLQSNDKLKDNLNDNLFAPIVLAEMARKYNLHFTYIGTGCIFDNDTTYDNHYIYNENDSPDYFGSNYSIVKGFTDKYMKLNSSVLNLRIRMPISNKHSPRNFITKIINYNNICSIPNSMTVIDTLFPYIIDMMKNNITGTFNFVNPGIISHNEILELYKTHIDPSLTWNNITIEEQNNILQSKRSNNHLDSNKLLSLYPDIPNIKDAITNTIINMKL